MRLSKDLSEVVTNKLGVRDFLTYAEGESFSNDFWERRLRKDFALLFAKTWEELFHIENSSGPESQIYHGKVLNYFIEEHGCRISNKIQDYELKEIFSTIFPNYKDDPKTCYLKLSKETVQTTQDIVAKILRVYGPMKHFIDPKFEQVAFDVMFTWLLRGLREVAQKIADVEDVEPKHLRPYAERIDWFAKDHFWSNKYWYVFVPMFESDSPGTKFSNSLILLSTNYYSLFLKENLIVEEKTLDEVKDNTVDIHNIAWDDGDDEIDF